MQFSVICDHVNALGWPLAGLWREDVKRGALKLKFYYLPGESGCASGLLRAGTGEGRWPLLSLVAGLVPTAGERYISLLPDLERPFPPGPAGVNCQILVPFPSLPLLPFSVLTPCPRVSRAHLHTLSLGNVQGYFRWQHVACCLPPCKCKCLSIFSEASQSL